MGIYIRKDSPFLWMLLEHSGDKKSTGILTPKPTDSKAVHDEQWAAAQDIYRAEMTELAKGQRGLSTKRATILFDPYADWYAKYKIPKHKGAERERELLPHLRAAFGSLDLTQIDDARVSEYETARLAAAVGKTGRTVKPGTVNREVALLKMMLRDAAPKYLEASPLAGRKELATTKIVKRVVRTADEELRLLATMTPEEQAFYLTGVDSMMRLVNLLNLRRDEDKGTYFDLLDSKTGPYTAVISTRVRVLLDALPTTSPYYFPRWRKAKTDRDRRSTVRRWLQRRCKEADIPYGRAIGGVTFHTATRGTGATRLLRAGVDLRTVQLAGHWEDVRSMMEYMEEDPARAAAAVNAHAPQHADLAQQMAAVQAARAATLHAARSKGGRNRHVIRGQKRTKKTEQNRTRVKR